jgi:hypothetical protein
VCAQFWLRLGRAVFPVFPVAQTPLPIITNRPVTRVPDPKTEKDMIREFFKIIPDYQLSRTSTQNVIAGVTSYEKARALMWKKAEGAKLNEIEIQDKLDAKKVRVGQEWKILKSMSVQEIVHLPDEAFQEVLRFYMKHPYGHRRVSTKRWIPRFFRTLFFRQLAGQAMLRKLDVNLDEMFEMMEML